MPDLGPHATYISLAYGFVALVCVGLILSTWLNAVRQSQRLARQEDLRKQATD